MNIKRLSEEEFEDIGGWHYQLRCVYCKSIFNSKYSKAIICSRCRISPLYMDA